MGVVYERGWLTAQGGRLHCRGAAMRCQKRIYRHFTGTSTASSFTIRYWSNVCLSTVKKKYCNDNFLKLLISPWVTHYQSMKIKLSMSQCAIISLRQCYISKFVWEKVGYITDAGRKQKAHKLIMNIHLNRRNIKLHHLKYMYNCKFLKQEMFLSMPFRILMV